MGADLGGGYDPGLGLDGAGAEQGFPVGEAGGDGECAGVEEDLGWGGGGGGGGFGVCCC